MMSTRPAPTPAVPAASPPILASAMMVRACLVTALLVGAAACDGGSAGSSSAGPAEERLGDDAGSGAGSGVEALLARTLDASLALADSVEDLLRPVPLMRPADEQALRRYSNAENLVHARRLGARPANAGEMESLVAEGRLVRLPDSTRHWVVRELGASEPYVTPATVELLERIGEGFQRRLEAMGLPPLRFEISSALRTSEAQAALRRNNVNATAGTSAHEFGTTVDIAYSGYAAPLALPDGLVPAAPATIRPALERVAREVVERIAARKSRELKAILGEALLEAQSAGEVMVTLERLQPVYHITIRQDP